MSQSTNNKVIFYFALGQLGLDEVSQFLEGRDLLILHVQLNAQLGFQIHDHLDHIQGINAQAFEGGIGSDLRYVQLQLLGCVLSEFLKHR